MPPLSGCVVSRASGRSSAREGLGTRSVGARLRCRRTVLRAVSLAKQSRVLGKPSLVKPAASSRRKRWRRAPNEADERELRALVLEDTPPRDSAWEFVGALKRLNLRLGDQSRRGFARTRERPHPRRDALAHLGRALPKSELRRLLAAYRAGRATPAQKALAVERLTFPTPEARGGRTHARSVGRQLYLGRLALALLALLVALGASATSRRTTTCGGRSRSRRARARSGTLSGVLKLRDHLVRLDELRGFWPAMRVQPLVGASAGALVFMILSSNAVSIGTLSAEAWSSRGCSASSPASPSRSSSAWSTAWP